MSDPIQRECPVCFLSLPCLRTKDDPPYAVKQSIVCLRHDDSKWRTTAQWKEIHPDTFFNLDGAKIEIPCDHEWEPVDDSFDHEFGTEVIRYLRCEKCGVQQEDDRGDPDEP